MRRATYAALAVAGAVLAGTVLGPAVRGQAEPPAPGAQAPPPLSSEIKNGGAEPLAPRGRPAPALDLRPVPTEKGPEIVEARSGKQEPAVSVEWVGPSSARLNQPIACQMIVRNTSSVPVHNILVRHP